jgi:hypothetical protein
MFKNEADTSSSLEYDINKTIDLNNFKIEQIHIFSSSNKNLRSLEELPLSIKKLTYRKNQNGKCKNIKGAMKAKYSFQQTPVIVTVQVKVK